MNIQLFTYSTVSFFIDVLCVAGAARFNPLNLIFQNKCMEDLGCFYSGPPFFHPLQRPISVVPIDKKDLNPIFMLFTRSNPDIHEIQANEKSISDSTFNPKLDVKVIIHGYMQKMFKTDLNFGIKDALLRKQDMNVIIVNWTDSSGYYLYPRAFANGRVIAAQVAQLLDIFIERGVKPENIHLIGHSLGAHLCGWIGERIPKLGRITGLDPAGPYFYNAPKPVCLDTSDAQFVDVIHSNGGSNIIEGIGLDEPVGHIDFYPNGGKKQPGCTNQPVIKSLKDLFDVAFSSFTSNSCSHVRSLEFFLESVLREDCRFTSVKCDSYADFEKGKCKQENSKTVEMGLRAGHQPGMPVKSKVFLKTKSSWPFCNTQ